MPSLSLISSTACRTLVLDFELMKAEFGTNRVLGYPQVKKFNTMRKRMKESFSTSSKTFHQKKGLLFFQMKKIVKKGTEAVKNRF